MSRSIVRRALGCVVGFVLVPGCGLETYEQRLAETNEYFKYVNKLDTYLAEGVWDDPAYGVTLRVPRGFVLQAAPAPPAEGAEGAEAEEVVSPVADPRQPAFLGVDLPGMIAAFRADDGQSVSFLYVLGNHERVLIRAANDGVGDDPGTFLADLELLLQNAIGVTIPEQLGRGDRDNEKYTETIPREPKYAVPKEFTAISFLQPEAPEGAASTPELRLQLYEHLAGDMQVAILMIFQPKLVRSDPRDALKLSLETLRVRSEPPRLERPGEADTSGGVKGF
jgi:hypothetical protein